MEMKSIDKILLTAFVCFLGITFLYLLHIGVLPPVKPDTIQYLDGSAFRAPGYTAFLKLDTLLVGANNFNFAFLIQLLLGFAASLYAGRNLKSLMSLPYWTSYLFSIIFLIPYFFGDYKFANRLLSEGICYPLYLFGFTNLLRGLVTRKLNPIYTFLISLYFMVLIRPQMIFLYPIAFAAWLYVCFFFDSQHRNKLLLFISCVVVILGANITDRTYHYLKHNHFAKEPTLGLSVAVAPLYLSQKNDAKLIKDPLSQNLFLDIHERIVYNHANIATFNQSRADNIYYQFAGSYNPITWDSMIPTFKEHGINDWFDMNKQATNIAIPLLKAHWKQYLQLWFFAVKEKFGGYYGLLFYSLTLILCFFTLIKHQNKLSLILFFVLLTAFANYTSVALVEVILRRYSSYTEAFQLCVLLAIVYKLFTYKLEDSPNKC